jgi:hypothetical protein
VIMNPANEKYHIISPDGLLCASGWAETHARDAATQAVIGPAQEEALFLIGESRPKTSELRT